MPLGSLEEREGKLQKKKKIESDAANQPHLRFGDRDESEGKGDWGRDAPSWPGSGDKKRPDRMRDAVVPPARGRSAAAERRFREQNPSFLGEERRRRRAGEPSTENDRTERV